MLALKNLARRKIRTGLTVLGVGLGVAAVVALVSIAQGMRGQLDSVFTGSDAHLVLTRKGAADPFTSFLDDDLVPELRASPLLEEVHPFLLGAAQIPRNPFFFTFGVTRGSTFLQGIQVVDGVALFDAPRPERAILLGRKAAESLEHGVGDMFELVGEDYEVVGIFESAIPFVDFGGILDFPNAQEETGLEGKLTAAMVRVNGFDPARLAEHEAAVEAAFPGCEASDPGRFTQSFDEFELLEEATLLLSLLGMFIGGFGVMNTMLMSVFERTREIGVLQAIGWGKGRILSMVVTEAALVCAAGGVFGGLCGTYGLDLFSRVWDLSWVRGTPDPWLNVYAVVIGLGMGIVGSLYPALRAARISPIEALRYE